MSSASQIDYSTMSEDQLAEILSKMKCLRETEALRARLPAQLAPFASNISITKPTQTARTSRLRGIHCCSCGVKERRIRMSVAVVRSAPDPPHSQSQDSEEPHSHAERLELVWRDWWTISKSLTGCAASNMHSISIIYGPPHRDGKHSKATAYTGVYTDPGTTEFKSTHGNIKSVVEKVVRDMGFRGDELGNELIIEALLGDDGRQLLESRPPDERYGPTLREIIKDELEEERYD